MRYLTTKEAFYKWYLSTDWILVDTTPRNSGYGLIEYQVEKVADME